MKDKRVLILVISLMFLLLAVQVHAQTSGFLQSPFLKAFGDWLTTPVQWPPIGQTKEPVAPLAIILVSIALFAVILAAVRRIPLFQDDNARRLATWLALPIAGISITGTQFVSSIWGIVGFGSDIASIILFVLLIIFAITLTARGIGASGIRGGPIGQAVGDTARRAAEGAANVVRTQANREERDIAQESQLFQQVDNLEGQGIKDAVALEGYINQMISLLGSGQSLRQIAEGINARLGRLNTSYGALVRANARATALDTQLSAAITAETGKIERTMLNVRKRQLAAPGAVAGTFPTEAEVKAYTADLARNLNDARTTAMNLAANGPRLITLEGQIKAGLGTALTTLGTALASRDTKIMVAGIKTARTELITARSMVAELITIMQTIETEEKRIRGNLMRESRDLNAEEHLNRI